MADDDKQNQKNVQNKSNDGKWEAAPLKTRFFGAGEEKDKSN